MAFSSTSLAPTVAVGAVNEKFGVRAENRPSKILAIGLYDEATKTSIVKNTIYGPILSAEDAGNRFGFGFSLHRLVLNALKGGQGVPIYCIPMDQDTAAPLIATGTITIVATSTAAGIYPLYIAGIPVPVSLSKGLDETTTADAIVLKINANTDLPVTATNVAGLITVISKDVGLSANDISMTLGEKLGDATLTELSITSSVIVQLVNGSGLMDDDMATALAALGTGDSANELDFTHLVHGFGDTAAVLDDIQEYVGDGDTFTGLYAKTLEPPRPFVSMSGDVDDGGSGLTAALALANGRRELDRANGQFSVPGSPNHPNDIAALATGIIALKANDIPAQTYNRLPLPGILPGSKANDWTSSYDSRDTAVQAGNSPTKVVNGTVQLTKTLTFYHPAAVSPASNGYKSVISIVKLGNILRSWWLTFVDENWRGNAVVGNVANVTDPIAKAKAKDINSVLTTVIAFTIAIEKKAWIYDAQWTIDLLNAELATRITVRPGNTGWNVLYPIRLSGEGDIINGTIQFDADVVN